MKLVSSSKIKRSSPDPLLSGNEEAFLSGALSARASLMWSVRGRYRASLHRALRMLCRRGLRCRHSKHRGRPRIVEAGTRGRSESL